MDDGKARDAIALGRSTKTDVAAALGQAASAIDFDSGYSVWVYRDAPPEAKGSREAAAPPPKTESIVLFDPSSVATKARVRSGA